MLIFSVDQGWAPLCDFLETDVPSIDFPRVNDKAEMKKKIGLMSTAARTLVILIPAIAIAMAWMIGSI